MHFHLYFVRPECIHRKFMSMMIYVSRNEDLTYALMACIGFLILVFLIFVFIYLCLRHRGYCQQRPDDPEDQKPLHAAARKHRPGGFFGNWRLAANKGKKKKVDMSNPVFDWAGRQKQLARDSKETQTGDFHKAPGRERGGGKCGGRRAGHGR